jgi:hypothetical protein
MNLLIIGDNYPILKMNTGHFRPSDLGNMFKVRYCKRTTHINTYNFLRNEI